MDKFKSNPYNYSNHKITESDILNILSKHNIQDYKIKDLKLFQRVLLYERL